MRAFDPWIGPEYWTRGLDGLRLLVLGESQYASPDARTTPFDGAPTPQCRTTTQAIVQELALDRRNAFFTKITKLLLGRPAGEWLSDVDRVSLWNRVSFYNYVQWWLQGSRFRPTEAQWRAARAPFLGVVEELQPHLVLVLGNELATWLPSEVDEGDLIKIPHPSSKGFSYQPWAERIRQAMLQKQTVLSAKAASAQAS